MAEILKNTNIKLGEGTLDKSAFNDFEVIKTNVPLVSPTTGSLIMLRQGNQIYLKGQVTIANSGDRIANLGYSNGPGGDTALYIPIYGAADRYIRITTIGALFGYRAGAGNLLVNASYIIED